MYRIASSLAPRACTRSSSLSLSFVASTHFSRTPTALSSLRCYHGTSALHKTSHKTNAAPGVSNGPAPVLSLNANPSTAVKVFREAPSSVTPDSETSSGKTDSSTQTGRTDATAETSSSTAPPPPHSESLVRRLFASWQQGVVASIGAVMGIGFLLYFLYTPVKEDTVHHTAVVASEALADARLKSQAVQLSKEVVLEVLRDSKSLDKAADVVVQLLAREDTKIAVSSLLQSLFEDHYTQEVTKKFVLQVVQDPWIQDQLQAITEGQVRRLLRNAEVKKSLSQFLLESAVDALEKPQLHYEVARAVRHSAASVVNFWWN